MEASVTATPQQEPAVTASPPPAALVQYGQQCASAMGMSFSIDMIIGLTNTMDVTKRLMEIAAQPAPPQATLSHDYIHKISGLKEYMDGLVSAEFNLSSLNSNKSALLDTIQYEQSKQARRYNDLNDILRKIQLVENSPSKTVSKWFDSLKAALNVSQFTFVGTYGSYVSEGAKLRFISEPLVCGHVNRTKEWNHHVNLGRFICDITLTNSSFSVRVKGFSNNIKTYNNYIHPHVSSNGEVCWGTASDPLLKAYNQADLAGMLGIIYSVLTQYNYDNPYVGLYRFETNKELILEELEHTDITSTDAWDEVDTHELVDDHFTMARHIPIYDFAVFKEIADYTKQHDIDISRVIGDVDASSFKDHDIPKELSEGYGVFSQFMISLRPMATADNGEAILGVDSDRYGLVYPRSSTSEPKSVRSDAERLIKRYSLYRLNDDSYTSVSTARISSGTPYSRDVQLIRCQDQYHWSTNEYAKDKAHYDTNKDLVTTLYKGIDTGISVGKFSMGTIVVVSKFANRHGLDSADRRYCGIVVARSPNNGSYAYHVYFPHIGNTLQYTHSQLIGVPYEC